MQTLQKTRSRYLFSCEKEQSMWQRFWREAAKEDWLPSQHTIRNVRAGRVSEKEIGELMRNGDVRGVELGTDDPNVDEPKPKLLVSYGDIEAAVAVGVPMTVITAYRRDL